MRVRRLIDFGDNREADLSTQQARAQAPARLPRPHGDGRRPQGVERAPRPRPQEAFRLIAGTADRRGAPRDLAADATAPIEPQFLDKAAPAAEALGRLRRRAEFQRVARGRRKALDAFTLQAVRREDGDNDPAGPRVGFTITRKVGNAVVRNRIRRRLKEALRAARLLEAEADHDYVLIARREALARSFAALVEDLRRGFRAVQRIQRDKSPAAAQISAEGRDRRS